MQKMEAIRTKPLNISSDIGTSLRLPTPVCMLRLLMAATVEDEN
jgi:hypothetical protein